MVAVDDDEGILVILFSFLTLLALVNDRGNLRISLENKEEQCNCQKLRQVSAICQYLGGGKCNLPF